MRRNILFLAIFTIFWLLCPSQGTAAQQFIVVIDPGHGGGDPGTLHRKLKQDEKTIALSVGLKLGALIKEKYPNVKIVYTRDTDVYPTLPDRTRIAREAKGNLFISIHVNAAPDTRARGVETYVFGITGLKGKSESEQQRIRERTMIERENLDINGNQIDFETAVDIETKILCQAQREKHNKYSLEVAHYVQDNILTALRRSDYRNNVIDRGVKQKNIFVLCYSPMPAILIELGYMSNTQEEKFMNTDKAKEIYANAIFKGFEQYHNNWKRRQLKEDDDDIPAPVLALEAPKTETPPAVQQVEQTVVAQPETTPAVQPQETLQVTEAQSVTSETPAEKVTTTIEVPAEKLVPQTAQTEVQPVQAETQPAQAESQPVKVETQTALVEPAKQEATTTVEQPVQQQATPQKEVARQESKAMDYNQLPVGALVPDVPAKACFRIQFISSASHFKRGDKILKGLWPVFCYELNGYYRYTTGEGNTRAELQETIRNIRKQFPDAFIVRFDEKGKRIP